MHSFTYRTPTSLPSSISLLWICIGTLWWFRRRSIKLQESGVGFFYILDGQTLPGSFGRSSPFSAFIVKYLHHGNCTWGWIHTPLFPPSPVLKQRRQRKGFNDCSAADAGAVNVPSSAGAFSRTPCSCSSFPLATIFLGYERIPRRLTMTMTTATDWLFCPHFYPDTSSGTGPPPWCMLPCRNICDDVIIVVSCISELHSSSGSACGIIGGVKATSRYFSSPLPR